MPVAGGIHYEWYGDAGLPPVVMSAGLGGLGSYWEPNLLALADEYRVLVYDHRGTGQSVAADETSIAAMAQDVIALLVDLDIGEPAGFVGHAIGGLIGLEVAMREPDLLGRIMVVNSWPRIDPHTVRCFAAREALLEIGPEAYLKAQPLFLYPPAYVSEHDAALTAWERDAIAHFPGADTIRARIAAAKAWDPGKRLGQISVPVMCLGVKDDFLVPVHASQALADTIPGATLATMSHGGHALNVTRPNEFNARVIDWLR